MLSRLKLLFLPLLLLGFLFITQLVGKETHTAVAAPNTIPRTDYDLIRNGGFSHNFDGWRNRGGAITNSQIEATADPQGGPAVKLFTNGQDPATVPGIYQEIHLPTSVTTATLSFNVRVAQAFDGEPPQPGELINGWIAIVPVIGDNPPDLNNAIVNGAIFGEAQGAPTGWLAYTTPVDQSGLDALNNARTNNQRLVLMLGTIANSWRFSLLIDNVSLTVDGTQTVPSFTGEIAYIHNGNQIRRVSPHTAVSQTVWSNPEDTPEIHSVRWNPAATELAFASNHEKFFSPMATDIYGMRPNGSQLRRITNAPAQSEIASGNYAKGSVRLNIFNNGSAIQTFSPFVISVRGAANLHSFALPPYQQTSQIVIDNVANLGGNQPIIFIYSSPACGANRRETAGFVTIQPGQTVDLNVTFNATNCGGLVPYAGDLTWKRDGSEIGYMLVNGAYKVAATGQSTAGSEWFSEGALFSHVAWSPNNDFVLYDPIGPGGGIYRRDVATNNPGTLLVNRTVWGDPERPAWLPDGSGFLYIFASNLYTADAQGNNQQQLTFLPSGDRVERVSPSPDGQYVVLERKVGDSSMLWLMERANPANMWPLIAGTKPDWSRVNPSTPVPPPPPPATDFVFLPLVTR